MVIKCYFLNIHCNSLQLSSPSTVNQLTAKVHLFATVKMPFTCNDIDYSDMIFMYRFYNGNAWAAVAKYKCRYSDRRFPDIGVFYRVYQHLCERGCFPGTSAAAEHVGADQDGIVKVTVTSPTISSTSTRLQKQIHKYIKGQNS